MSENQNYNPNMSVLAYSIDTDTPPYRVPLSDVIGMIVEMDVEPAIRNAHIAGLLAARLSLQYIDSKLHPVHEKACDVGMLGALGCHITEREPLTPAEMDNAEIYQRFILHTRVLDDFEPEAHASLRAYHTFAARARDRIKLNHYGYQVGRTDFASKHAHIVADYRNVILHTHPRGDSIDTYRKDTTLAPLVERFLYTRRSLLSYVPDLAAQEHELWQYARAHYARYILPNLRSDDLG